MSVCILLCNNIDTKLKELYTLLAEPEKSKTVQDRDITSAENDNARPSLLGAPPTPIRTPTPTVKSSPVLLTPRTPSGSLLTTTRPGPRHSTPREIKRNKTKPQIPLPPDFQPSIPPPNIRSQTGPVKPTFISTRDPRVKKDKKPSRLPTRRQSPAPTPANSPAPVLTPKAVGKPQAKDTQRNKRKMATPKRQDKKRKVDSPMSPFPDDSFSEVNADCGLATPKETSDVYQQDEELDSIIDQLAPGAQPMTPDRDLDLIPTKDLVIGTPTHADTPKVIVYLIKFDKFNSHISVKYYFLPFIFSGELQEKGRVMLHDDSLTAFIYVVSCSVVIILPVIPKSYNFSSEEKEDHTAGSHWISILPLNQFLFNLFIYTSYLNYCINFIIQGILWITCDTRSFHKPNLAYNLPQLCSMI